MSIDDLNTPMSENELLNTNDPGIQPEPVITPEPAAPVPMEDSVPGSSSAESETIELPNEPTHVASPSSRHTNVKTKGFKKISNEIEKLAAEHKAGESYDFRSFFIHARQIIELFKKTRDISDAHRKELWDKCRKLYDGVVHLRIEKYPTSDAISTQLKENTVELIKEVIHFIGGAYDKTTMQSARDKFKTMNNHLVNRTKSMHKPDADYCWQAFRKCKEQLDKKAESLNASAMEEAKGYLATALKGFESESNPFEAMKIVIEERNKTKDLILSKEDTDEIIKQFNELWAKLAVRLDGFKLERKTKREARNAKRKQRKATEQTLHLRDAERLDKLTKLITTIESEIADLEIKRDSASGEEYRTKVQNWIDSKKKKLTEFSAVVADLKTKVSVFQHEATPDADDKSDKTGEAQ